MRDYIPNKGDIVWIDFNPSSGSEIKKRKPALVISKYSFNKSSLFAVVCPITSTFKDSPTRVSLSIDLNTKGQIILTQLKSLDFRARNIEYIETIDNQTIYNIEQIINYIFKD